MLVRQPSSRAALLAGILIGGWLLFSLHQQDFFFHSQPGTTRSRYRDPSRTILDDIDDNGAFGFDQIFVVGLPQRTDRRDGMVLQAATSDVNIEFIDGVMGDSVPDKAVPPSKEHGRPATATLGSWRAHMNAIQEVVRRNLTSALIMEDDVDWDVRIRSQLRSFALSSQALTQPLAGTDNFFVDPTFKNPDGLMTPNVDEISFESLPKIAAPTSSPYGDNWDVLWLGHCGMQFPSTSENPIPKGRVVRLNDETTPEKRYQYNLASTFTLRDVYPEHTRVVHHVQEGVCSLAYAVTQRGARRMLREIALKDVSDGFDLLLRFFCEGTKGRRRHICLTSQPALFNHHRTAGPASAMSDIGEHGDEWRDDPLTDMIRWSTRLNADVLMDGGDVFHDSLPDTN